MAVVTGAASGIGVVYGTRHAYPVMRAQGFGHIVNTVGVALLVHSVASAMTRHAVIGLSASARVAKRR